jgi:hypothetical protein
MDELMILLVDLHLAAGDTRDELQRQDAIDRKRHATRRLNICIGSGSSEDREIECNPAFRGYDTFGS